jgi:alpha-L-arabinofuranosidase
LLANVNPEDKAKGYPRGWQWDTNLIGYDALHSFGSPSYYVLAMFGQNRGDVVLPAKLEAPPVMKPLDPNPHGLTGVGVFQTQVEYKDIVVTAPDGRKLSSDNLVNDAGQWQFPNGEWTVENGVIKPRVENSQSWALAGDPKWENYTIRLRARKLGGAEGFIVMWHSADGDNYRWWNIGGWGNTITRCEVSEDGGREAYGPSSPFTVETGRWYDLRLEVNGHSVRGFIDDNLVIEAADEALPAAVSAYASASYANATHDVIVKVVNNGADPLETKINLKGASQVGPNGTAIVLSGEPTAINTIDQPINVVPKKEAMTNASASFTRTFPPRSLTLLRLTARPSR